MKKEKSKIKEETNMKKQLIAAILASVTLASAVPAFSAANPLSTSETNQPAIEWGGDITVINYDLSEANDNTTTAEFRLTADAKISDKTHVLARLTSDEFDISGDNADYSEDLALDNIYIASKLGSFDVNAGRFDATLGQGLIYDDILNGVAFTKDKFTVALGRQYNLSADEGGYDLTTVGVKDIKVGSANLGINYGKVSPLDSSNNVNIWGADVAFDIGKIGITAQYAKSNAPGDPNAYRVDAQLGSSPITLGYQKIEAGSITSESALDWIYGDQSSALGEDEGTKGWDITYSKEVTKNTTFTLKYSDLKGVDTGSKEQEIRTTLEFKF
jgi:hypothetical protein